MTQRHTSSLEGHQPAEEAPRHQGQADQTGSSGRRLSVRQVVSSLCRKCAAASAEAFQAAGTHLPIEQVKKINKRIRCFQISAQIMFEMDYVFMPDRVSHELSHPGQRKPLHASLCGFVNTVCSAKQIFFFFFFPTDDVAAAFILIFCSSGCILGCYQGCIKPYLQHIFIALCKIQFCQRYPVVCFD